MGSNRRNERNGGVDLRGGRRVSSTDSKLTHAPRAPVVAVRCCTHAAFSAALTASCGWRTHRMQRVSGGSMRRRARVHSDSARRATVEHTRGAMTHRDGLRHNAVLAGDRKHVAHGSCGRPNLGAASAPAASERSDARSGVTAACALCRHTAAVPGSRCAPVDVELKRRERGHHLGQEARGVVALSSACGASEGDAKAKAHARGAWVVQARAGQGNTRSVHRGDGARRPVGGRTGAQGAHVAAGATSAPRGAGCAPRL